MPNNFCVVTIINVSFFSETIYISTSKIMSSSTSSSLSQAAGIAAQFGISLPTGQSDTKWVYPEIIRSRTLAKSVIKENSIPESSVNKKPFCKYLPMVMKQKK